jgi:D-alanyl-D-alanine carboxypeptidase
MEKERRETASLTKIMTAYTVLNCCDKLGIDLKENVSIGSEVSEITGTSAFLLPGDNLTIE